MYSIWVCTKPSDEFQNTLTRYSIRPEQLIGNAAEKSENYDLMSVVTICLGKPDTENYTGILKFLDVLLSSSRAATEKKKILEEEFGVAMSEELEREVLIMCNLSQGVKAEGREEGIGIGRDKQNIKSRLSPTRLKLVQNRLKALWGLFFCAFSNLFVKKVVQDLISGGLHCLWGRVNPLRRTPQLAAIFGRRNAV